jgi:type III restriction enzyme
MGIGQLIINSPYDEPQYYWQYDPQTDSYDQAVGRRPAGYLIANATTQQSSSFYSAGHFMPMPLVNQIRQLVKDWRQANYPGITSVTRSLLNHWYDLTTTENYRHYRFFFCQLEAIETLIWLTESPPDSRPPIPSDGSLFRRLCCKMATGTGKTVVMAMLIAWQVLNKITYPEDPRFSTNILIIAPGLTVKSRLQVLLPSHPQNYYQVFQIVPHLHSLEKLRQGKILINNWHALQWETDAQIRERKSVDKRGAKSDLAYAHEVLGDMAEAGNLIVINDEAHHAWRLPDIANTAGINQQEWEAATKWMGACDRLHRVCGIINCFDFSATPFIPGGKKQTTEKLFSWIVSDFNLNDAIESGLVKTPRIVIRDAGLLSQAEKFKFYHIYQDQTVKTDINRKAKADEPLPQLIIDAYNLLGKDWLETYQAWQAANFPTPPVMITIANRVETSSRIKYAFDQQLINIPQLCQSDLTLQIDSRILANAELEDHSINLVSNFDKNTANDTEEEYIKISSHLSQKAQAELLRQKVNTIGQVGELGEQIRNVISVGMLSEGWDVQTVTHIMGLRAFSSQLLCEQVVGRGLRRKSYEINPATGLLDPEYVNIFGIPYHFLPHETHLQIKLAPTPPKIEIKPILEKQEYAISWPNILRIERINYPLLSFPNTIPLLIDDQNINLNQLAEIYQIDLDLNNSSQVDAQQLLINFFQAIQSQNIRLQTIIFRATQLFLSEPEQQKQIKRVLSTHQATIFLPIVKIVNLFIQSDQLIISPNFTGFNCPDHLLANTREYLIMLNMPKIIQHIWQNLQWSQQQRLSPIFQSDRPIISTADLLPWHTGKPCQYTKKCHINYFVYTQPAELLLINQLENDQRVEAWVKNTDLVVYYLYKGKINKYYPDFIIRLNLPALEYLLLVQLNINDVEDHLKLEAVRLWMQTVNQLKDFGQWQVMPIDDFWI